MRKFMQGSHRQCVYVITDQSYRLIVLGGPLGRWPNIALEIVQGTWYDERLRQLDLYSVKGRLLRTDLIQYWKLFHGKCPFASEEIFTLDKRVSRGHNHRIFKERFSTSIRQRFFTCRVVNDWNSLPPIVVDSTSVEMFKARLADHLADRLYQYND